MRYLPVLAPPVIFFGLVLVFWMGMFRNDPNSMPLAIQGQIAPVLELEVFAGKPSFTNEALNAPGVKLVNFWASWCGPCRTEHPSLMALAEEGLPIYGVNYKDDPAAANRFITELGDPYLALGADPRGRNGINWGVIAMPETFVIDGSGTILMRHAGPITSRIVEDVIRPALVKAGQSG